MYQLKKKVEDIFLKFLLKKDFHEIEIIEIQKKSRISTKKFFQLFKTKEEIMPPSESASVISRWSLGSSSSGAGGS